MATQFRSAGQRNFWLGMLVVLLSDAVVAYLIALFFADNTFEAAGLGLLILLAAYLFQAVYGLISLGRAAGIFFLLERKTRTSAVVDQMVAARMPRPDTFYADPIEYLLEVAKADDASNDAKLLAGATIGSIETLRTSNRPFLAMCLLIVLEDAISRYAQSFGLRNLPDDEALRDD